MGRPIVIGIDVDGVLRDFAGACDATYRAVSGARIVASEYEFRRRYPAFPMCADLMLGAWLPAMLADASPMIGATGFLRRFEGMRESKARIRFRFVSYQPTEAARAVTLAWLSLTFFLSPDFVRAHTEFVRSARDKQGLDVLLDDNVDALEAARSRGTLAVCFDHPYNRAWGGPRVRTHAEFCEILGLP